MIIQLYIELFVVISKRIFFGERSKYQIIRLADFSIRKQAQMHSEKNIILRCLV